MQSQQYKKLQITFQIKPVESGKKNLALSFSAEKRFPHPACIYTYNFPFICNKPKKTESVSALFVKNFNNLHLEVYNG